MPFEFVFESTINFTQKHKEQRKKKSPKSIRYTCDTGKWNVHSDFASTNNKKNNV